MDFVRTTPETQELEELRDNPAYPKVRFVPVRSTLEDHDIHRLRSAPYELIERVDSTRNDANNALKEVTNLSNRMVIYATLMFAVLAIMISALGLMVASQSFEFTLSIPIAISTILSVVAVSLSLFAFFKKSK